jgi:hypothetical protein
LSSQSVFIAIVLLSEKGEVVWLDNLKGGEDCELGFGFSLFSLNNVFFAGRDL